MSRRVASEAVFIDTCILERENFDFGGVKLSALAQLSQAGRVHPLTTTITVREVTSHLERLAREACGYRPKKILRNSRLPEVAALFTQIEQVDVVNELIGQFEDFQETTKTVVLDVCPESVSQVLDDYFAQLAPFENKKKAEFPDAFVVQALLHWSAENGQDVAVVSADRGVQAACARHARLEAFEDLADYLDAINHADEKLVDFVYEMVAESGEAVPLLSTDFGWGGFSLVDVDGDVSDAVLVDVEFDGDIEVISHRDDSAIVQMGAVLTFEADISYIEPGTECYDSEDGVTYGGIELHDTVTRSVHRDVVVNVGFRGLSREGFGVGQMRMADSTDIELEAYPPGDRLRRPYQD